VLTTRVRSLFQRLRTLAARLRGDRPPPSPALRGATIGLLIATAGAVAVQLRGMSADRPSLMWALGVVLPTTLGYAALAAAGVVLLVRALGALPLRLRAALGGCAVLLVMKTMAGGFVERLIPTLFVLVPGMAVGAAAAVLSRRPPDGAPEPRARLQKAAAIVALALGLVAFGYAALWWVGPGVDQRPIVDAAKATAVTVPPLDLPDPSAPGPFAVKFLTYGSGHDKRRPEYAAGATLRTRSVDGSAFFKGWQGGLSSWGRTRYWGFGPRELPIDARVFYPEPPGPRPVVVLVHGGHNMEESSEAGYDYLGEHLASQGFVAVLVDENFLNGASGMGDADIRDENAARGWLVLQHLQVLRRWNGASQNPLAGRLDLDRVALLGHSKGGEAIAVAAALNRLPRYPDDATLPMGFGFGIRALIAFSVTDKQLLLGGVPIALPDVSYLALQGSNDGDVDSFLGSQQLERVRFTRPSDAFKASVYIHRASHAQYNRVWGHSDKSGLPRRAYFNRKPILTSDEQERIAKTYVTAFVQATLAGDRRYLPLFHDARVGARWLPDTIYISRFAGSSWQILAGYDEDVDVTTTTLPGGILSAENLTVWREGRIGSYPGTSETRGVFLGWDADALAGTPSYTLTLPPGGAGAAAEDGGTLVFSLADANLAPNPRRLHRPAHAARPFRADEPRQPIDLTVELVDLAGHTARVPLASVRLVQPQLDAVVWKAWWNPRRLPDTVLGTWEIPLARFVAEEPAFEAAHIKQIRFVFDRSPAGVVALKDVGFRPAER
jgi:predicted dienelactone hydrolase